MALQVCVWTLRPLSVKRPRRLAPACGRLSFSYVSHGVCYVGCKDLARGLFFFLSYNTAFR